MKFNDVLKGKRIELKATKPTVEMAKTMFETVDNNRKHLDPWFAWTKTTLTVEDSMKYLFDKEEKTKNHEIIEYGIYVKGNYVGNISIFKIDKKNRSAEIGYWLSLSYTRKGYVSEAVMMLEKEAFENLGLNRLVIVCDERNIASSGVAKKCGFNYEGKLREEQFSEHFNDFRNTLVFSKLKSDDKNYK